MTAFRSTRLALFHGWTESPLWERTPGESGNVDLSELPVSDLLRQRLRDWNERCGQILSTHGFDWPDEQTSKAVVAEGSALADALRAELGIEIVYTPDGDVDVRDEIVPSQPPPAGANWSAFAPLSGAIYRPRPQPPESG